MDKQAIRLLLKEQSDAFTTQIAALHKELQAVKLSGYSRHGSSSNQGFRIPRSMRLDVLKFNGVDPDAWIFAINEYFELLETTLEQRLHIIGFNLEGDDAECTFMLLVAEEGDNPGREIPADPAYYIEDKVDSEGEENVTTRDKGEDEPRGSWLPRLDTTISVMGLD
ncbi:hypothetical protein Tco_1338493 [Tanacetum coccineum]